MYRSNGTKFQIEILPRLNFCTFFRSTFFFIDFSFSPDPSLFVPYIDETSNKRNLNHSGLKQVLLPINFSLEKERTGSDIQRWFPSQRSQEIK